MVRGTLRLEGGMEKGFRYIEMGLCMMDIGGRISIMVMVKKYGWMELDMMDYM